MKNLKFIGYQLYIIIYILSKRIYTQDDFLENPENNNMDENTGTMIIEEIEEEYLTTTEIIITEGNFFSEVIKEREYLPTTEIIITEENYTSETIKKENYLPNAIKYSESGITLADLVVDERGDLFCFSNYYGKQNNQTFFYGLKRNGRPYFLKNGKETPFYNYTGKTNGQIHIFTVKKDETEYIFLLGDSLELYDFNNEREISCSIMNNHTNYNLKNASILKLNNDTNYTIYFIGQNYFYLKKFIFGSINFESNSTNIKFNNEINETIRGSSNISSCFESVSKYIFCFYLNNSYSYKINVFNYNLILLKNCSIQSNLDSTEYFYKAVHFTGDAGAFLYCDIRNNINIEFKSFKNNEIIDLFNSNSKINIILNNYLTYEKKCDMIKLADKKICTIFLSEEEPNLHLYIINNYISEKIIIRHYKIEYNKFYNFNRVNGLSLDVYNGFLAMASTSIYANDYPELYASLIIFSYGNSSDININITDNIINKENIVIDLFKNCRIENNLFGYIIEGIKIDNYSDYIRLFNESDRRLISKEEIINPGTKIFIQFEIDIIELFLTNEENIESNYIIEYSLIVTEPEYDIFNLYPENIDTTYCGKNLDEKYNFSKNSYYGKTSYYQLFFDFEIITKDFCIENCLICLTNNKDYCLKCEDEYKLINNTCRLNYYFDNSSQTYKECHENCRTCDNHPLNSTYFSCLTCENEISFHSKSANCLDCARNESYVNFYQYKCIDSIPDGYYLSNIDKREIDSCYKTCKTCMTKGNESEHKCIQCSEAYPYNYKNGLKCLDDCSKEYLYTDFFSLKCYSDCINNTDNRTCNYKTSCINCEDKPKNYILYNNTFVSKCNPRTEYEFNNECYKSCPPNTKLDQSEKNKNLCICKNLYYLNGEDQVCVEGNICPDDYPYLKTGTSECNNCPYTYQGNCILECPENTCLPRDNENLDVCVPVPKYEKMTIIGGICFETFSLNLKEFINERTSIIQTDNIMFQINTNFDQKQTQNSYSSLIDLGECGDLIKNYYGLSDNEDLIILKVDKRSQLSNSVTNDYDYVVFLPNGTEVEDYKTICENSYITVSSYINDLELAHFEEAMAFNAQGYDIYDLNSEFYNDRCTAASINGNDIVLRDRINDIYPYGIKLCPNNCEIQFVEFETKRFNCSCKFKDSQEGSEQDIQKADFVNYVADKVNYQLFFCYMVIKKETIETYFSNVGFISAFTFILCNIFSPFIFYYSFIFQIKKKIYDLIPKKTEEKNVQNPIKKEIPKDGNTKKKIDKNTTYLRINKVNNSDLKRKRIKGSDNINDKSNSLAPSSIRIINNDNSKNNAKHKGKKIKKKIKKKISKKDKINNLNNNENNEIQFYYSFTNYNDDEGVEEDDYNELPYTQALRLDKRNYFNIFYSVVKMKFELIVLIFFPEEYTHRALTLSIFIFNFIFDYFMNALLYTEDIVSEKYHNDGQLEFITSNSLSLASIFFTYIVVTIIKITTSYNEYLKQLAVEIKHDYLLQINVEKVFKLVKLKAFLYYIISLFITIVAIYYLYIFCAIYKMSQNSLLKNYLVGVIQSFVFSFIISFIVSVLRIIGLKFKLKKFYRASVQIDKMF